MQPIPVPVTNVSVYPYIPNVPIEVPPVITDASGTYSVGTLLTSIFYNLDLEGGERKGDLQVGSTYYALATADGKTFQTHWMYCLEAGSNPRFGLTKNLLKPDEVQASAAFGDQYINLGAVENVTVTQTFRPPAIGTVTLISDGVGELIATRTGTPHLMGFRVRNTAGSLLHVGMQRITVRGERVSDGQEVGYSNMVCTDAGNPAVFLQDFPGK